MLRICYIRIFSNGAKENDTCTLATGLDTVGRSVESNIWTRGRVEMCQQSRGNGLVRTDGRIIRNLPRELHGGEAMDDFRLGRRLSFPPLPSLHVGRCEDARVNRKQPQT